MNLSHVDSSCARNCESEALKKKYFFSQKMVELDRLIYADLELPKTTLHRIIKNVTTRSATIGESEIATVNWSVQKDAKTAIVKATTLFISYLTAASIEVCNSQGIC